MIDDNKKKFIAKFHHCFTSYKKFKKDYFIVKLLYSKFCQQTKTSTDELKEIKLKGIINTHRCQRNGKFNFKRYQECEFFWENLNLYILGDLSLISTQLKKAEADDYSKEINKSIEQHFKIFQEIIKNLKIEDSKFLGRTLKEIIFYFKNVIKRIKRKR